MRHRIFLLLCGASWLAPRPATAQSDARAPIPDGGISCISSDDCAPPKPYCQPGGNYCVECLSDVNCGSRGTCSSGRCVDCVNDAECPHYLPYCDHDLGTCVECRVDGNCGKPGVRCSAGQCGTCGDGFCSSIEELTGCPDCGCFDPFFCADGGFGGSGGYYEAGYPSYCGDNYADYNEDCDGFDLGYGTCYSVTLGARPYGSLYCTSFCTYDVSGCYSAGSGGFGGIGGAFAGGGAGNRNRDGGTTGPRRCTPGQQVSCPCPDGPDSVQQCSSDGTRFNPCQCSSPEAGTSHKATATPLEKSGGCGCRLGAASGRSDATLAAWIALSLTVRRRRRVRGSAA